MERNVHTICRKIGKWNKEMEKKREDKDKNNGGLEP